MFIINWLLQTLTSVLCQRMARGCSHKCVNTAGGFKCDCPDPELSLSSDKRTCEGKYVIII